MQKILNQELTFVDQIRKHIVDNKIMLSYKGVVSQEIILALLKMTEKNLDSSNVNLPVKSKVINVMVNCLQNITFHSDKLKHLDSSMFTIGRNQSDHAFYSGNAVKKAQVPELSKKLDEINKMSEKELKDFYQYWLKSKLISDKKSIGLGLIDIARKTGSDLNYDFANLDNEYSYFLLRTIVKAVAKNKLTENDLSKNPNTNQKSLNYHFDFYKLMKDNNIILLYANDFSQELTKTLLNFTERKLSADELEDMVRRRIFNIMVELLQNISKNAIDNDNPDSPYLPIFMISESEDNYHLISSNKIYSKDIEKIKASIDQVNSLDSLGLKQLYKKIRLNGSFSNLGGAGIGIIDMARKSEKEIKYSFNPITEEFSMFTIQIQISKIYSQNN